MAKKIQEIFTREKPDRRLLANVPDPTEMRKEDRRMGGYHGSGPNITSKRYLIDARAILRYHDKTRKLIKAEGVILDISLTGMLISFDAQLDLQFGKQVKLKFKLPPGALPEGFESRVAIKANVVRFSDIDGFQVAFQFSEDLKQYTGKRRGRISLWMSSLLLFLITLMILFMRAESIIFYSYNAMLYAYSIITAAFLLSRYFFGFLYRPEPINLEFKPGVSIIIPCFNEEEMIQRTILSCMNQNYPIDKLEVIVVDDCSNDHSYDRILEIVDIIKKETRFQTEDRIHCMQLDKNKGKREALIAGTKIAKHEFVTYVDSDSFLQPDAIVNLVQPMQDPLVGGVTGRTDVANKYTNMLTRMQAVRYYIAFRIMKAAESIFDAVTCLSGPISCYRKELIFKYEDNWLNQKFLGHKATFGDDRSMTNFILREGRTCYQDTAVCATVVPSQYPQFIKQQMRWKRSWLRESIIAAKYMWRKEPAMALSYYMGFLVPVAAPIVVTYNLMYVPLTQGIFPTTFLTGLLLMALLMSFANMFFMRSILWLYGLLFCIFYEVVLLWQMPIAWVTFWKSTWGTRMTPQDLADADRKKIRRKRTRFMRRRES